jgi:hypothetical protein
LRRQKNCSLIGVRTRIGDSALQRDEQQRARDDEHGTSHWGRGFLAALLLPNGVRRCSSKPEVKAAHGRIPGAQTSSSRLTVTPAARFFFQPKKAGPKMARFAVPAGEV